MQRKRQRDAQRETLEALGFTEGERPSDKVRQALREAVAQGNLPEEGLDDGTPWRYYPGGDPNFDGKAYAQRMWLASVPPNETERESELRRHGEFAASRAELRRAVEKAA